MSKTETLSIDLLRLDAGTQARVKTSEETVVEYAELLTEKTGWPFNNPVDVFHDGTDYFVADGFHRVLAANRVKRASVPCNVHSGTAHDAKIFGMTANDRHGLRMSRADKRACVEWLLDNGGKLTQTEVAKKAGVTTRTVQTIVADRREAAKPTPSQTASVQTPVNTKTSGSNGQPADNGKAKTKSEPVSDDVENDGVEESSDDGEVPFDVPEAKPAESQSASIMLDSLGKQIPKHLRPASELAIQLQSIGRELDKYRKTAKDLAAQPGGEWLNLQTIDDEVRSLKNSFQGAQYHTVCPRCDGNGCQSCNTFGYLPEHRKNNL